MTAVIDLIKVIELKKVLEEKFGLYLHFHDSCGGQYFSIENLTPEGKEYIINYFKENRYNAVFDSEDKEFYLEDIRIC